MKIRPVGAELFHADGRTERHDDENKRFLQFCERSKKILRSAHTVYLWGLYESENKQRLFPYTTLTEWFV